MVLALTDGRGRQQFLPLDEVLEAWCYSSGAKALPRYSVPALIVNEGGEYRLAFGQRSADQYNERSWMRGIRIIDIW